ncbi:MAG: ATP-binding cassette domain-containing protein [Anaerovoracaceae bacterium]
MRNKIITCLFWLAVWQAAAQLVSSELLLPGPADALLALGGLAQTGKFYMDIGWTAARCIMAMALSFAAGIPAAVLSYRSRTARSLLSLPVGFFKAVPVMAIIIYVILLAQSEWVAVIVCFFMCFPIVYTNILEGLDAMPSEYLEVGKIYGLSSAEIVRYIYVPGLLPQIKAAISLTAGLSWKAVVAAEVLSIPKYSLGYEMINAKYYLETADLFAYIFVIVVLSMAFEKLIKRGLRYIEWKGYEESRLHMHESRFSECPAAAPRIEVCGLTKTFEDKCVLDNVNMVLKAGNVTALMGPSGQGKTTLARIIAGLETADSGNVIIGGREDLNGSYTCRTAFLFQEDRLLPWLNIYDNIAIGGGAADPERIRALAQQLEIETELWKLPDELSGGQRHRAALARTFAADAPLMILDEPFRGLDSGLKARIIDRLWEDETAGRTVLLITHIEEDAAMLADNVVKL